MFVELATKLDYMIASFDVLTMALYIVLAVIIVAIVVINVLRSEKGFATLIIILVVFYFGYGILTCPV